MAPALLPHPSALLDLIGPTTSLGLADLFGQTSSAATQGDHLTGSAALLLLLRAGIAALAALVVAVVVHVVLKRVGRRSVVVADVTRRARTPLRVFLVVLALRQVAQGSAGSDGWLVVAQKVLDLGLIAAVAWLVAIALFVVEDVVLARYRTDVADNRHARRVRTQVTFVRRVLVGVVLVLTVAAMLFTFPSVKQVGAGIFASAGLISVVAGLAAQTSLANVFAGLQLAFTDALRVDDVVVVQQEWGRIEEITLTYVVVHVWDDRRLVLPSTYFTSTPFENWTRKDSQLLGVVLLEVDWTTDFEAMREELRRVVEADELWDRRVSVLQVTDAVGSFVQVRILVSAQDGPTVFDLRCHVREAMVGWLVRADPSGLPRLRIRSDEEALPAGGHRPAEVRAQELTPHQPVSGGASVGTPRRSEPATPATRLMPPVTGRDDSLFTGSFEALERSRRFSGPSEAEQAERAEHDRDGDRDAERPTHPGPADGEATRVLPAVPAGEERQHR